jgi:serine O-acetyltransferase
MDAERVRHERRLPDDPIAPPPPARPAAATPEIEAEVVTPPYPGLRALIWSDITAYTDLYGGWSLGRHARWLTALRLAILFAGLRATMLYRVAHALHRKRVRFIPTLISGLNVTLNGFEMGSHIEVGPRFYVPHPVGTVVEAERLGSGVTLVSAITIGMRNNPPSFPVIGNDIYVGAGARILGGITIGDRVQIGANAVVIKDVPNDSVAIGVPATIRPARPQD